MQPDDGSRGLIEQNIEAWFRGNVAFPDKKLHGTCVKVVLRHVGVDNKFSGDVQSWPVKLDEGGEEESYQVLMHKVADAAQRDTDDQMQGMQKYAVCAYYDGDRNYVPRKYFRVSPSDVEIERDLSPSEPATEKGLVAQAMRHLEVTQRTAAMANGHLFLTMQGEMKRLSEMCEKFTQSHVDFLVLMQDLLDNASRRRIEERKEETAAAMKESAMAKLEAVLPVIVNRLSGKTVLPEDNRIIMLLASLLENMDPAQQELFYGSLSDGQKLALAELLGEYEKGKNKILEREKRLISLGGKHGLPPAEAGGATSKEVRAEILDPVSSGRPLPQTMSLRERLALPRTGPTDPHIQKIEGDASRFTSNFRDMLRKPTEGDKK